MQNRLVWVAFLLVCFFLTGLTGLFATYSASIPLERAIHRSRALDAALQTDGSAEALQRVLGPDAGSVAQGGGDLASRVARAREMARTEGEREAAAVASRTRLLIAVVTVLAAGVGAMILLLAAKGAGPQSSA